MSRMCFKCDREESKDVPFPKEGNQCKKCDAARKAEWYQAKKAGHPPKSCLDCGKSLPSRYHRYCIECKEMRSMALARRKAQQYARSKRQHIDEDVQTVSQKLVWPMKEENVLSKQKQVHPNQNRDRMRLIQRARRICEDCGVLLPVETIDAPRLKYCESCIGKRKRVRRTVFVCKRKESTDLREMINGKHPGGRPVTKNRVKRTYIVDRA